METEVTMDLWKVWSIIGPILGSLIGFVIGVKREMRLGDRDFLRREVYEPLYSTLDDIHNVLSEKWLIPPEELGDLKAFVKKKQTDHMLSNKGTSVEGLLNTVNGLEEAAETFLDEVRRTVVENNDTFAPLKGQATAYDCPQSFEWPGVMGKASPMTGVAGMKNCTIVLPNGVSSYLSVNSCKNVNVFADSLKVSWDEYFEKLGLALEGKTIISRYRQQRESVLKSLDELIEECRGRKLQPFTFRESLGF